MKDLFGKWWFWLFLFPIILGSIGWLIVRIILAVKAEPEKKGDDLDTKKTI